MMERLRRVLRFLSLSPAARVNFGLTSLKGPFKEAMAHDSSVRPLALWRSDRQRIAPCARQGDPGCVQSLVALDKPLIRRLIPAFVAARLRDTGVLRSRWPVQRAMHLPQMMEKAPAVAATSRRAAHGRTGRERIVRRHAP